MNARAKAEGEEAVFTLKVLRNGAGRREGVEERSDKRGVVSVVRVAPRMIFMRYA
jgi:hypothetical protein